MWIKINYNIENNENETSESNVDTPTALNKNSKIAKFSFVQTVLNISNSKIIKYFHFAGYTKP